MCTHFIHYKTVTGNLANWFALGYVTYLIDLYIHVLTLTLIIHQFDYYNSRKPNRPLRYCFCCGVPTYVWFLDSSSSSDTATNSYQIGGTGNADGPERSIRSYSYRHHSRPKRVVPPATSIPRFRKYAVDDFNFLKVLGKGSFGKVRVRIMK